MTTQTPAPEDLDSFEARLLAELRAEVADSDRAPATRRWRRSLAAGAGIAATVVVGMLLVPGLGSTAAYSVQEGNSGEVTVEVHRPEDAAGLERALAEHGIAADVTFLPDMQTCAPGRYTEVVREVGMSMSIGEELVRVTLPPGAVRPGETFVMALSVEAVPAPPGGPDEDGVTTLDGTTTSVTADVAAGPVGPCDPVTAPGTS